MQAPRIYVDLALESGIEVTLPRDAARHLRRVLRMPDGAPLLLFNGEGGEFEARLRLDGGSVRACLGAQRPVATESALEVGLAQGLSRGARMDYTIQKAVELGVGWIQPLVTDRSVVRPDPERTGRRARHWRGVVASACEQCGRAMLPPVHDPLPLDLWLERLPPHGARLVAVPGALRSLAALPRPHGSLVLLVGPEGGLGPHELTAARERGFRTFSLGPRILRTETAAVVALSAAQLLWGDLGGGSGGQAQRSLLSGCRPGA